MDPSRRYISRISTNGYNADYRDYRNLDRSGVYMQPAYPTYPYSGSSTRQPVLVDTTSNYNTHLRSLFYPPRPQTFSYDTVSLEKKKANAPYSLLQSENVSKQTCTRQCLLAVIAILVLIAIVTTIVAIVLGVVPTDVKPPRNTTNVPPQVNPDTNSSNLIRGTLTLDNLFYDDQLQDPTSPLFKLYRDRLCTEMVNNLKQDGIRAKECDILEMSQGSLVIRWVIGLTSTNGMQTREIEAKAVTSLTDWLATSFIYHGRVNSVYRDACSLVGVNDKPCQHICVNDPQSGQASCRCEEGYTLDTDGKTCSDVNECLTANCPGRCDNTAGSYRCLCPSGYRQADNGKDCIDINECQTENGACSHLCNNTLGGHECSCLPGFTKSGTECLEQNECLSDPCQNNGHCSDKLDHFTCLCPSGFLGSRCEIATNDSCLNATCPAGYRQAKNETCIDINECECSPCEKNCVNTAGSFYCTCDPDEILTTDRVTCTTGGLFLSNSQVVLAPGDYVETECRLNASAELTNGMTLQWYSPEMELIDVDVSERIYALFAKQRGLLFGHLAIASSLLSDSGNYSCVLKHEGQVIDRAEFKVEVSVCGAGGFYCRHTNTCIPLSYVCNNLDDCGDNEDELDCDCDGFRCRNSSRCLNISSWCDRHVDCDDGSDEMQNCTQFCPAGFIECKYSPGQCIRQSDLCRPGVGCDGGEQNRFCSSCNSTKLISCNNTQRCIAPSARCNQVNDCGDWEDERSCHCFPDTQCSQTGVCVKSTSFCDNVNDCGDGEDERKPCAISCTSRYTVKCNSTGDCIQRMKLCNEENDCGDWEDEKNCGACLQRSTRDPRIRTHFRCDSGECLHYGLLCDSRPDCTDGSDENYCIGACPQGFMRCNRTDNGRCIPEDYTCDNYYQCEDGEDEEDCEEVNRCKYNEVKCNNTNRCISSDLFCNGYNDCGDNEDEVNCTCRPHQFRCSDGVYCKDFSQWCDGHADCDDGSDEFRNCTLFCPDGLFHCNNATFNSSRALSCIPQDKVCDGTYHCLDGTDEMHCACPDPYDVRCNGTNHCISSSYICDGYDDCGDNEDELNCPCGRAEFRCLNVSVCRGYYDWCNGVEDCLDGTDEYRNCSSFCPDELFRCNEGSRYMCIPQYKLCNGYRDCDDGADEINCTCPYPDQVKCNGTYKCIWPAYRCDNDNDCGDYEDEIGCGDCSKTQFKCDTIDMCLDEGKWCDGKNDCPDGSDEPSDCHVCVDRCAPNEIRCDGRCLTGEKKCDQVLDCSHYEDEKDCVCTAEQFKCQMGMCIDKIKQCDRHFDCPDETDEMNCTKPCGPGLFACASGDRCISEAARCDMKVNCPDSSDERNCEPCNKDKGWSVLKSITITSPMDIEDKFKEINNVGHFNASCSSGMCINAELWCNNIIDCPDGSDEASCKRGEEAPIVAEWIVCPQDWFRCKDHRKCIPPKYVCDLLPDCDDESDEDESCPCPPPMDFLNAILPAPPSGLPPTTNYPPSSVFSSTTTEPLFDLTDWRRCNSTGSCFPAFFLCDNFKNCLDGSDEVGCSIYDPCPLYPKTYSRCDSGQCIAKDEFCDSEPNCVDKSDEMHCRADTCSGFLCDSGRCVPSQARCNRRRDCQDWTDEFNCPCDSRTQYRCPQSDVCVDKVTWCDGVPDCPLRTDETNCTNPDTMCYPEQFYCDGRCIDRRHVCDGTVNCRNASDEQNCDCSFLTFNCTIGVCLSRDKWCDGTVDCLDGSDEKDDCLRTCPAGFSWCDLDKTCVHPIEVCFMSDASLCQANTTEPQIDCTSVTGTDSICGLPGIVPHDITPYIFNGDEAKPHSWPWLVGLYSKVHGNILICGGSIIHPQWVVTAAHCVETSSSTTNYNVVVGNHRNSVVEPLERNVSVAEIKIHENWDTHKLLNDIALLRLSEPLQLNEHVRPVCVPKVNFAPGKLCTVIGWGDTLGTADEDVVNEAHLPIITQQTCQYWHRETSNVTSSMICAGYEDGRRGNCYGDSGGPLLCEKGGRFWIQGLVTWGKNGCKAEEAPMVFTRIPYFYDWIAKSVPLEPSVPSP